MALGTDHVSRAFVENIEYVANEEDKLWFCFGPEASMIKGWLEQYAGNVFELDNLSELRSAVSESRLNSVVVVSGRYIDDSAWSELLDLTQRTPGLVLVCITHT